MMPDHSPVLVPAPVSPAALPLALSERGFPLQYVLTSDGWWYSSLVPQTMAERTLLTRAADLDGERLETKINATLECVHVYLRPAEFVDKETGEVQHGQHQVLICADGSLYCSAARGVYNSIRAAVQGHGEPPWTDPVVWEVRQLSLPGAKRTFKLRLLGRKSELAGAAAKPAKTRN